MRDYGTRPFGTLVGALLIVCKKVKFVLVCVGKEEYDI